MDIISLKEKHFDVSPEYELETGRCFYNYAEEHVDISLKFAIELLKTLKTSMESDLEQYPWWYTDKVENKIEELKSLL